jgi:hypothetical protein
VITDLSEVSTATTAAPINGSEQEAFIKTERVSGSQAEVTRYDIDRFYLAQQPFELDPRQETAVKFKGDVALLNKKAVRYPEFSYQMLNRTLPVAEKMAATTLAGRELPSDIKRVILTATLTPTGRLSDLAIEQHSGTAVIDQIMIDACKRSALALELRGLIHDGESHYCTARGKEASDRQWVAAGALLSGAGRAFDADRHRTRP